MVSNPKTQIAWRITSSITQDEEEKEDKVRQLARLVQQADVCPSCWRLFSNGTRGTSKHVPEDCILEW